MIAITNRDKKRRQYFFKIELKYLILKTIIRDQRLPAILRKYYTLQFYKLLRNVNNLTKIRNRCLLTGRSHSLIKHFKLTHKQILTLGFQGYLFGIHNSTW